MDILLLKTFASVWKHALKSYSAYLKGTHMKISAADCTKHYLFLSEILSGDVRNL